MAQRWAGVRWTHRTPAGLPRGIPGIGDEMDGAMQQAPHPRLQRGREVMGGDVPYRSFPFSSEQERKQKRRPPDHSGSIVAVSEKDRSWSR